MPLLSRAAAAKPHRPCARAPERARASHPAPQAAPRLRAAAGPREAAAVALDRRSSRRSSRGDAGGFAGGGNAARGRCSRRCTREAPSRRRSGRWRHCACAEMGDLKAEKTRSPGGRTAAGRTKRRWERRGGRTRAANRCPLTAGAGAEADAGGARADDDAARPGAFPARRTASATPLVVTLQLLRCGTPDRRPEVKHHGEDVPSAGVELSDRLVPIGTTLSAGCGAVLCWLCPAPCSALAGAAC